MTKMEGLLRECVGWQPHVLFALLFGSHARGNAGPLGDIDIAVWLDEGLSVPERGRRRMEIIADCMARLGTNEVDVVVLNDAPPVLAFEVAREGLVLFTRAPELPGEFRARAFRRYLDTEHMRRTMARYLEERIAAGRVGEPVPYVKVGQRG